MKPPTHRREKHFRHDRFFCLILSWLPVITNSFRNIISFWKISLVACMTIIIILWSMATSILHTLFSIQHHKCIDSKRLFTVVPWYVHIWWHIQRKFESNSFLRPKVYPIFFQPPSTSSHLLFLTKWQKHNVKSFTKDKPKSDKLFSILCFL